MSYKPFPNQLKLATNFFPMGDSSGNGKAFDFYLKVPEATGLVDKEPTGISDSTNSYTTMTFTNSTRTFSIAPVGANFVIYVQGKKFTFTTAQTIVIPNTEGTFYIYFDTTGTIQVTSSFSTILITDYAFIFAGYWDLTLQKNLWAFNERHGLTMDGSTHALFHTFLGSEYKTGFGLSGFTIGDGSLNTHAQFQCDLGTWADEDINFSYSATTQFPIVYRSGASALWKTKDANAYPFIESGATTLNGAGSSTAVYTGANGRPCYNQNNAGTWGLTELGEGAYVLLHLTVVNDETKKVFCFLGTNEYYSPYQAWNNLATEINEIKANLPLNEHIFIGSVLLEVSVAFANTPKARVNTLGLSGNYTDLRPINPKNLLTLNSLSGTLNNNQFDHFRKNFANYLDCDFVNESISGTANVATFQTTVAGTGSAISFTTGTNNDDTVIRSTTGTTNAGSSWFRSNGTIIFTTGRNYELWLDFDLNFSAVSAANQRYVARAGMSVTSLIANNVSGVFVRYSDNLNSGNIQCVSRNASVESVLNSTVAGGSAKVRVRIQIINGTDIYFYLNETKVAGSITTNIPVNIAMFLGAGILKTNGTTTVNMDMDYLNCFKFDYTGRS